MRKFCHGECGHTLWWGSPVPHTPLLPLTLPRTLHLSRCLRLQGRPHVPGRPRPQVRPSVSAPHATARLLPPPPRVPGRLPAPASCTRLGPAFLAPSHCPAVHSLLNVPVPPSCFPLPSPAFPGPPNPSPSPPHPALPCSARPCSVSELLERRRQQQARYDAGDKPGFLPETKHVRRGGRRQGAAAAALGSADGVAGGDARVPACACAGQEGTPLPESSPLPATPASPHPPTCVLHPPTPPHTRATGARGRLARGAAPRRLPGPAGGDHGAHRPQDGHQRAQQVPQGGGGHVCMCVCVCVGGGGGKGGCPRGQEAAAPRAGRRA